MKVINIRQSYEIHEERLVRVVKPGYIIARVVDIDGKVNVIRTKDPINIGDEIDIVSKEIKQYWPVPEITTETYVIHNRTQQQMIQDFVQKNKTKSR